MAMAYVDEEVVWKCRIHPSKRRRHGVCALCLRDKLISLCPNCASVRPCACPEPPAELRRSRTLAVTSFLRSKSTHKPSTDAVPSFRSSKSTYKTSNDAVPTLPPLAKSTSNSFWFKLKTKKREKAEEVEDHQKMTRSKSVGMALFSNFGSFREGGSRSEKTTLSKGWFASSAKGLKQSKQAAKVNHENSPVC
uniref:Uncharacterized protein n=1 Tax=Kalanchoe fedtschenkoi TaxID=63787 RepID=A0A7N0UX00_KALFE